MIDKYEDFSCEDICCVLNQFFIKVDFFEVNEKTFYGRDDFYKMNGAGSFELSGRDMKLGKMLQLPVKIK